MTDPHSLKDRIKFVLDPSVDIEFQRGIADGPPMIALQFAVAKFLNAQGIPSTLGEVMSLSPIQLDDVVAVMQAASEIESDTFANRMGGPLETK